MRRLESYAWRLGVWLLEWWGRRTHHELEWQVLGRDEYLIRIVRRGP